MLLHSCNRGSELKGSSLIDARRHCGSCVTAHAPRICSCSVYESCPLTYAPGLSSIHLAIYCPHLEGDEVEAGLLLILFGISNADLPVLSRHSCSLCLPTPAFPIWMYDPIPRWHVCSACMLFITQTWMSIYLYIHLPTYDHCSQERW